MKFNVKVWKANKGNKKAAFLARSQKHIVIDVDIEADNGNYAYRKLYEMLPEIKTNWDIKLTNIG